MAACIVMKMGWLMIIGMEGLVLHMEMQIVHEALILLGLTLLANTDLETVFVNYLGPLKNFDAS